MPQQEQLDRIEKKVDEVKHLVTGNGSPEKGISFRVAALESKVSAGTRLAWVSVTALTVLVIGGAWELIKGVQ